jgi:hypothetical membrane protein
VTRAALTWTWRSAAAGSGLFAVTVLAEHIVNSQLSPWNHQISEYANGSTGWLMTIGFVGWAVSLTLTAVLLQRAQAPLSAGAVAVAAIGLALIAVFHTQAVAGRVPVSTAHTAQGHLHNLGGELLTGGLLSAALFVASASGWARRLRLIAAGTILYFAVVTVALQLFANDIGGLRQRLMLLGALAWHAALLAAAPTRPPRRAPARAHPLSDGPRLTTGQRGVR